VRPAHLLARASKGKRHSGDGHLFIDVLSDDKIAAPYNYGVIRGIADDLVAHGAVQCD
jgi:hypothetical protein